MDKIIATTFLWVLSFIILILTMIYGWGLEPKSWWWIIGGGIFTRILIEIMTSIVKKTN